jgi:hypothetical protein
MTTPIPKQEPQNVRAGTTWQWRREDLVSDYPASKGWTLKYYLKNPSSHFEITATADGDFFAITVPIGGTGNNAALASGTYRMVGVVEDAGPTQRYQVYEEEIVVEASYASTTALDDRSHSRKVLEAIRAVIENRATKDQEEYSIGHRQLRHTPLKDLRELRQEYEAKVAAEDWQDKIRQGQGGTKIVARL